MSASVSRERAVREAYEADASGLRRLPDEVARPQSAQEVVEVITRARSDRIPVTCAGAQTSTTGASITDSGILLSLRGLDHIVDVDESMKTIIAGPGALVGDLKRAAAAGLLFAPDPTSEEESTIGGAIACNASGARTYKYGPTRRHVRTLRVVLANGELAEFRRLDLEKNTVGYAFAHDPIDWFIGSEGTLGVIIEAELSLLPLPEHVVGLAVLFASEDKALNFVITARESSLVARWLQLTEAFSPDFEPLVFDGEARLREARRIRHSIPTAMNERGGKHRSSGGRKVSTDWAVPYRKLPEAIRIARSLANGRQIEEPVIYGHAGNGHPHQNFVAHSAQELATIEEIGRAGPDSNSGAGRDCSCGAWHWKD